MKIKHIILIVLVGLIAVGTIAMFVVPHKIFASYIPVMEQIETLDMVILPDRAKMKFKIAVKSDGPIEALLDSISYKVFFDETEFSKGSQAFNKKFDKDGNDTITLPLDMKFNLLDKAFRKFEGEDSTDLKIKFIAHFHFPIVGTTTVPMDIAVRIPAPIRPKFRLVNLDLTKLRFRQIDVTADLMLINENNMAFKLDNMKLFMQIPGLFEGNIIQMDTIDVKAHDSTLITLPVEIDQFKMVKTAWKFLFDKEELEYIMSGTMDLILPVEQGVADAIKVTVKTKGLTPFAKGKEDDTAKKDEKKEEYKKDDKKKKDNS